MFARRHRTTGIGFSPPSPPADDESAMKGASVYRTTNYTSQNDNDFVDFDTQEYDTSGLWDPGTPQRITIGAALDGYFAQFTISAIWAGGTGNTYRELKLFKNGDTSAPYAVQQLSPNAANTGLAVQSRWLEVATDDYFTVALKSAGDETALAADFYSIYFSVALLPAT